MWLIKNRNINISFLHLYYNIQHSTFGIQHSTFGTIIDSGHLSHSIFLCEDKSVVT